MCLLGVSASVPALTVTYDAQYPPYALTEGGGEQVGIVPDLWNLWSTKTGEHVFLKPLPWAEALDSFRRGEADVLDTVFRTEEREKVWSFGPAWASIETAVYIQKGLAGIDGLEDLRGYVVGVKAGDASADALRRAKVGSLVEYPTYEALVDAVLGGALHVFVMDVPPAQHYLYAKDADARIRLAFTLGHESFYRAVPNTRPDLSARIAAGFALITPEETRAIVERWTGRPLGSGPNTWLHAIITASLVLVVGALVFVLLVLRRQARQRAGQLAGAQRRLLLSEQRAQAMVEALPDLLFLLSAEPRILECHPPLNNSLYLHPERFVGQTVGQAFGPAFEAQVVREIAALRLKGGVATVQTELEIRGRSRAYEGRLVRLEDDRFLALVRDVTESRRVLQDDLQRNKLESLAVLAGGLAHDFNNSLGVIQGFLSLARVQLTHPEQAAVSLDKAVQATKRAAGLTGQLRVLAHGSQVNRAAVSVKAVAEEAASFALVGSPCVLEVEAGDGPWLVDADEDQLSQVFHNLILNAVQAMPRGGKVSLVFRRHAGTGLAVSVVDEGPGISEVNLSRIFDPYFTTKSKGTGLGLSVTLAIVQQHGGRLEVNSREGHGTVFTVTLPVSTNSPPAGRPEARPDWSGLEGQRVLIMEDESDLRDLMVEVAESLGLKAEGTRNGREAIAAFDQAVDAGRPFPLVISDLLVPGEMGGREMIAHLRQRPAKFRALAVTGFSTDRSSEDFRQQGFDVIVGKPFTVNELKARISELMASPWTTEARN